MLDKQNANKEELSKKIDKLIYILDKKNIEDLIEILGNGKRMLFRSFFSGIAKGIGAGIGFTILTAVIIYFLQKIIRLNIPVIGEYVSDIVDIVNK